MNEERIPKRSEADPKYTWALEDIYPSDEAWKADFEKFQKLPEKIKEFKGKLGESGTILLDFMKLSDEISVLCDSLANYAQRRSDEDTANSVYQAMVGQLMNAYVQINSAGSFETPELISIDEERLNSFYQAAPELKLYKKI